MNGWIQRFLILTSSCVVVVLEDGGGRGGEQKIIYRDRKNEWMRERAGERASADVNARTHKRTYVEWKKFSRSTLSIRWWWWWFQHPKSAICRGSRSNAAVVVVLVYLCVYCGGISCVDGGGGQSSNYANQRMNNIFRM